jgi:GLPGLI family protein
MFGPHKFVFYVVATFFCLNYSGVSAQDNLRGIIYYDLLQEYDLEGAYKSPEWDSYISQLPKTGYSQYMLSFTPSRTLYEKDPESESSINPKMKIALKKASYMKPPGAKSIKVLNDFGKRIQIEQVEFLTKAFFVEKEQSKLSWKIIQTKKKVLDYMCLGAELNVGDDETITAYFSPQIPLPIGPGKFYGLPGAILSIEKNDVVLMEASSIRFWNEDEIISIETPGEGKTISEAEFEKIVEKKTQEYNINAAAKSKAKKKGKK